MSRRPTVVRKIKN